MRHKAALSVLLVLLLAPGSASAQFSSLSITAAGGTLRTALGARFGETSTWHLYPEMQIETDLASFQKLRIRGSAYLGYWQHRDPEDVLCRDCGRYAYRSRLVGARLLFSDSDQGAGPILLSLGIGRHFTSVDYLGGGWGPGIDQFSSHYAVDAGFHVRFPVGESLRLQLSAANFAPLPRALQSVQNLLHGSRHALHAGISYQWL